MHLDMIERLLSRYLFISIYMRNKFTNLALTRIVFMPIKRNAKSMMPRQIREIFAGFAVCAVLVRFAYAWPASVAISGVLCAKSVYGASSLIVRTWTIKVCKAHGGRKVRNLLT